MNGFQLHEQFNKWYNSSLLNSKFLSLDMERGQRLSNYIAPTPMTPYTILVYSS